MMIFGMTLVVLAITFAEIVVINKKMHLGEQYGTKVSY